MRFVKILIGLFLSLLPVANAVAADASRSVPHVAYLVSDLRIPYWNILWRGVQDRAQSLGYRATVYSAENDARQELENLVATLSEGVDGIVLSPTDSSAAVTLLKLANSSGVPVVMADIGTDEGDFLSFLASDNFRGSHALAELLVEALREKGWMDGSVGIIAIPQKRENGKQRTAGFMQGLSGAGVKGAGLFQQVDFSYRETYGYATQLIAENPDLRAIWLQGSDRYQAALDAIADAGRENEVLLICFDAEPEFLDLIPKGVLVGAGMQQPFLMGETAVEQLDNHLQERPVREQVLLDVLPVSARNIEALMPVIERNVLGRDDDR